MKITLQRVESPRIGSKTVNIMWEAKLIVVGNEGGNKLNPTAHATERVQALGRLVEKMNAAGVVIVVDLPPLTVPTAPTDAVAGGAT